uniref:Lon protease homolog n=1 Tax=Alexandrium monilatum TaxID=311494 RepID=A0A7S4Q027_9DINO
MSLRAVRAAVRGPLRVCSVRWLEGSAARMVAQPWRLAMVSSRHFAGRSSRGGPGERGPSKELVEEERSEQGTAAGSSGDAPAGAATSEGAATGSVAGAAAVEPGVGGSGPGGATPALFALPLYRKPAFPGFYQIVQVSEQDVLDFLFNLRKSGQGEYLGGFMTTELPSKVAESDPEPVSGMGSGAGGSGTPTQAQGLRRDAGRVACVSELEEVGTVLQVINLTQYPNISGGQVVVMPRRRVRRTRVVSAPSPNVALAAVGVEYLNEPEVPQGDENVKALHLEVIATMKELLKTSFLYKEQFEQVIRFYDLDHPLKLADLVAGMSLAQRQELQAVLTEDQIVDRLRKVLTIVKKDLEFARLQSHVKSQVEEKVTKEQRRLMLMEQMKQISKELGIEKDEKGSLIQQFRDAIKDKTLPEEANKVIEHELQKLGTIEPSSSEFNVCRTYLEWLTVLPWGHCTEENKDIQKAEGILNEDHYGLEDVKERILEHIAVSFLKESVQGKIMCLVGPPGVGKTSVGKSIARALDRKFYRFSVGGMHDVAEIRGHRRTYVGAMPGKLIQCLKITQSSNPVVLIDEIDKLGRDYRGDPSSALLEILDPEQNSAFRDHYLDVPVDLSRVLFVCTANVTDTIPGPLLDRMEVIRIAGYVFEEKVAIANQYLIPQTEEQSGIGSDRLELREEALHKMITDYAREAGVRHLRKLLEKVSRKVALKLVRKPDEEQSKAEINLENLTLYIGQPLHLSDRLFAKGTPPGVVMGLAWTAMGGASLFVEARGRLPRGRGSVLDTSDDAASGSDTTASSGDGAGGGGGTGSMQVTGQLGSVMNESSSVSLTYARLFMRELDPSNNYLDDARIHLNVPEGAVPKDGPSAGVTMASALVSLAMNKSIKADLAMTGELTLTGKVLKVGGIKEKVIAARREGIQTLLLPRQNEADYTELKEYLRAGLTAHFVDHYDDVYRLAFDESEVNPLPGPPRGLPVVSVTTPLAPQPGEAPTPLGLPTVRSGDAGEAGAEADDAQVPQVDIPSAPTRGPEPATAG